MSYCAYVTTIKNLRVHPNADRLQLGECFGNTVCVSLEYTPDMIGVYFPTDGQLSVEFAEANNLVRKKDENGNNIGGYMDPDKRNVKTIKLRGEPSDGLFLPLSCLEYTGYDLSSLSVGDTITILNGHEICKKYIPKQTIIQNTNKKVSYKGRKIANIIYPEFSMHQDTEQLMYNLDRFHPGDIVNLSLKMHGTSSRHMKTYAELPNGFFRRLFHMKKKTKPAYVLGSRRCIITENNQGYYGNDEFRIKHHKELETYIEEGMEIFGEIVGYYGPNETDTIMPIGNNFKVNDKLFIKEFGEKTVFNYGCSPGESKLYIYRITSDNGNKEWTPNEITEWCNKNKLLHVPYIDTFEFSTQEDLMQRINSYFEDLHDPIGKTHIKEGIVVRILNHNKWEAYKVKTYEFRIIEGIIKEDAQIPDIEEIQET